MEDVFLCVVVTKEAQIDQFDWLRTFRSQVFISYKHTMLLRSFDSMNILDPNNILQTATENPKILFGIQDNLECTV